jgi:UDP-glucose 4-epimerase
MRVLVVGGAGYIGSVVAERLLNAGHTVTVYDNLSKGHLAAVPAEAQFERGDILDRVRLDEVLSHGPYEAVMHFAAFIEAGESMREPGRFFHNNVTGSLTLIEAAVAHRVPRFVFSSSAGVYASQDQPLEENDPIGATSVYGHTKRMVEEILGWYHSVHELSYVSLRYFNAAGAARGRGEAHQLESHLIPLVLQVTLGQREAIAVYGSDYPTPDGTCVRDYIHIDDLATAHLLALEGLKERSEIIYNLGNGQGYSVLEVIRSAREITGHPIPAQMGPRRPGDSAMLVASSAKIRAGLGWAPRHPDLSEIILSAWQWHQQHPKGYTDSS